MGSVSEGTTQARMAAFTAAERDAVHVEQGAQLYGVLVGGATARALDPELVDQALTVEEAVDDVRVADVDGEEHCGRSLRGLAF